MQEIREQENQQISVNWTMTQLSSIALIKMKRYQNFRERAKHNADFLSVSKFVCWKPNYRNTTGTDMTYFNTFLVLHIHQQGGMRL